MLSARYGRNRKCEIFGVTVVGGRCLYIRTPLYDGTGDTNGWWRGWYGDGKMFCGVGAVRIALFALPRFRSGVGVLR